MTSRRAMYTNIISIVFAAAMIRSALLVGGTDIEKKVGFIRIVMWLVPFFYLAKRQNS